MLPSNTPRLNDFVLPWPDSRESERPHSSPRCPAQTGSPSKSLWNTGSKSLMKNQTLIYVCGKNKVKSKPNVFKETMSWITWLILWHAEFSPHLKDNQRLEGGLAATNTHNISFLDAHTDLQTEPEENRLTHLCCAVQVKFGFLDLEASLQVTDKTCSDWGKHETPSSNHPSGWVWASFSFCWGLHDFLTLYRKES